MTSWIQLQGTVVFATQRFRLPHNFTLHFLGHLHQGNLKSNGHLELLKLVQLSKRCAVCIGFGNVGKDEDGTDGTAEVRSHLRHWEVATTVTSTDGKEPYALWIVVRPVGSCWGGRRCKGNTGYSGYRSYPLWNETKCRSFQFSGRPHYFSSICFYKLCQSMCDLATLPGMQCALRELEGRVSSNQPNRRQLCCFSAAT